MRSLNAPVPGIVQKAVDLKKLAAEARKLNIAIRDGEALVERENESLAERRARLGKLLVEARKGFNARGDGFVAFVEKEIGIPSSTANRYMEAVGYVGNGRGRTADYSHSGNKAGGDQSEIDREKPAQTAPVAVANDGLPIVSEEERQALVDRLRHQSMPAPMDERARRTGILLTQLAVAQSAILSLQKQGIDLADATTSAEDFQRAKHLAYDIVRPLLDGMEKAGVLDGTETATVRRQLTLLEGGLK